MTSVKGRVKSLVERALGVTIARRPRFMPNQHADAALRTMRRWSPDDVVFDVGANDGRTLLRLRDQLADPRIFAFEPVASTYETLVRRTRHLPNVRAFQLALGSTPGRQTIYLNDIDTMNSFSPRWTIRPCGVEAADVSTVDSVMQALRIDFVHFLKIDTEGYELEVLKGADDALCSSRVAIVQVEVGVGQMAKEFLSLEQARSHLADRGYFLYGVYNQCRTRARPPDEWTCAETSGFRCEVLGYCDALFIRASL